MEEMINLHLNGNLNLFFSDMIKSENYDIYYSDLIEDEYWNYAYLKNNNIDLKNTLKEISIKMKQINRNPAIYITSNIMNEKLEQAIKSMNLELLYTDCWMFLNNLEKIEEYENTLDFPICVVDKTLYKIFAKTVMDGFSGDDPEDPYNCLPEGYRKSIERSFEKKNNGQIQIINYMGMKNNEPICTATVIHNHNKAVIYNITTVKKYQRKGICKQMMFFLINELNMLNIKEICLQTEKGYYTEEIYKKIGFEEKILGKVYKI